MEEMLKGATMADTRLIIEAARLASTLLEGNNGHTLNGLANRYKMADMMRDTDQSWATHADALEVELRGTVARIKLRKLHNNGRIDVREEAG
jgi:hypothetical protein